MKKITAISLSSVGYIVATFGMALLWHLHWFEELYDSLGYISREEPIIAFGFLSMLIQGVILSIAYQVVAKGRYGLSSSLIFCGVVYVFFWSIHVLAFSAKAYLSNTPLFIGIETVYLALQFLVFALVLGPVFKKVLGNS